MKTVTRVLMLFIVAVSVGCTQYRLVRNERDNSATWAAYRTFAFVDTNHVDPTPGIITYQATMEQVKRAVATELTNRGYQQVSNGGRSGQPDLLVNVGAVVNEKTQTRQTTIYEAPRYIGQQRYHWQSQDVPVGTYKEGTLSLHIIDSHRDNLIWDVAVASILSKKGATSEQINEAVRSVFTKFPGKQL